MNIVNTVGILFYLESLYRLYFRYLDKLRRDDRMSWPIQLVGQYKGATQAFEQPCDVQLKEMSPC